jgi:hypothetical protein
MRHHRSCQVKSGSLKSTTSNPTEFRRINTCVSAAADTVSADGARDSSGGEGIRRRGHTTPHHSARATPQRTSAAGADTSSTDEELRYANMDRPLLAANKRTLRIDVLVASRVVLLRITPIRCKPLRTPASTSTALLRCARHILARTLTVCRERLENRARDRPDTCATQSLFPTSFVFVPSLS